MKFKELNEMAFPSKEKILLVLKNIKEFGFEQIKNVELENSESQLFKSKFIRVISDLEKIVKNN